jgi:HPt (histidine-containing phosphotransfer) domain-containing protein
MYTIISEKLIYQYFGHDDPEMIKNMIKIILETSIQDLKELTIYYENFDFQTIKKRCHKAKPSMSYIGALSSKKLLEEIEANLDNSYELNIRLQKELNTIESELQEFQKRL